jgi:hypothetical protein
VGYTNPGKGVNVYGETSKVGEKGLKTVHFQIQKNC